MASPYDKIDYSGLGSQLTGPAEKFQNLDLDLRGRGVAPNSSLAALASAYGPGAWYDPFTNTAYDTNGKPIVATTPEQANLLQMLRTDQGPWMAESSLVSAVAPTVQSAQSELSKVTGTDYGGGRQASEFGPSTNPFITQLEANAQARNPLTGQTIGAVDALGRPLANQQDIASALDMQRRSAQDINTADAGNVAAAGAQGQAFRRDTASFRRDMDLLRRTASGQGPSAAEALAKSQLDDAVRSQAALAATARGGNIAAGLRAAARAGSDLALRSQNQMAALRAQEILNAQTGLTGAQAQLGGLQAQRAQVLQQARAQDIARATNASTAADQVTGQQLTLGEQETARQKAAAEAATAGMGAFSEEKDATTRALGAGANTFLGQGELRAKVLADQEAARQDRARTALDAASVFSGQGLGAREQRKTREDSGDVTARDVTGGLFSLGGAAIGAAAQASGGKGK
jgi:hypothetical protein